MLVINANNQQNVTNYMLSDPWYPDFDAILMWWWPICYKSIPYSTTQSSPWVFEQTPDNLPIIETIWTRKINHYCERYYKEQMFSSHKSKTPKSPATNETYTPDMWFCLLPSQSANPYIRMKVEYNIAVKWLKSWQIVWEKIYAPMMFWMWKTYNNPWLWMYHKQNAASYNAPKIIFLLVHSDWTETTIATLYPEARFCDNSIWTSTFNVAMPVSSTPFTLWVAFLDAKHSWQWVVAQDGDILVANVSYAVNNNAITQILSAIESWKIITFWQYYWEPWNLPSSDLCWFKPFQVSIRDA